MPESKAERRAAWKQQATESAAALRKAKATVTLRGKRSIPTTALTPAEIRVAAFRAEHPERVVVDPVTGKHTRIDTRTGAATVISRAPGEISDISLQGFKATDERLSQQSQRLAAERERAAAGAVIVAEARARPPDTTTMGPTPYRGTEYVPSLYKPGTGPEDVEYGERPTFDQPQITDIHEVIGNIIDVSAGKFKSGLDLVEGKDVDIDVTKVEEPEKYVTRNIHDFITGKTEEYRKSLETEETQQAIRTAIYRTPFVPPVPEPYTKFAPERLVTGLLKGLVLVPDIAVSVALGTEHAIRTEGEVYKDIPVAAGVMAGSMKHEFMTDPLSFIGEAATLPLITKFTPVPSIPTTIKPKVPSFKTKPSYDPMGFPAEFGTGKPVRKYIKKIPEDFKTFLKSEEAAVELKRLRKKPKVDLTAKLKEKWAKREAELESLAKNGGYTVTKEGQILISKTKQEPKVVSLIKDPWLEQFKMKPEEIVSTKMKVYPKVVAGKKVDVYIAKPKEVVKVFEPFKKEVSPQKLFERTHVVQSLKELQRLKALQEPVSVVKAKPAIKAKTQTKSLQELFERTQMVQSLKELQRLKALQEPVSVVKAKPAVKAKAQTKGLQEQRSALVVLLKTAETQSQREELRSIIASIDTQISSVSSTAATMPAPTPPIPTPSQYIISPIPTVDEIPPPPKPHQYVPPPTTPILEEIPPMPKIIPILKPKKPKKPIGFIRTETPGYAWQLANPIATLEQLLGVQKTTKKTRKGGSKR